MKNKIFLTSVLAMIVACPAVSAEIIPDGYIAPGDTSADCTSPDPLAYGGREYDHGYYTLRADWSNDECFIRLDRDGGISEANPEKLFTRFDDGAYLRKNGNTLVEHMYPKDDPTYPQGKNGLYEAPRGQTVSVHWNTGYAPTNYSTGAAYTVAAVADTSGERPFNGFWSETGGLGTQYIYDDSVPEPYVLTESGAQRAASIAKDANGNCPDEVWYAGYDCASDIPMPSTEPSLSGYNFTGWYTSPRSGGSRIDRVPCLYPLHQTYYARWSPKNYKVTYSCPSQVDGVSYNITLMPPSGKSNPDNVTFNSAYTMWNSTTACVGDGVECSGWNCTRTDGGTFSNPSTTSGYWQNASDVSCVAVCGSNRVNLIWDYNDDVSADGQTFCQYGTTGTINVPQPTRPGYTFNGWTVVDWDESPDSGLNIQPIDIGGSGGDRP